MSNKTTQTESSSLNTVLDKTSSILNLAREDYSPDMRVEDVGRVTYVGSGTVRAVGMPGVKSEEVLRFSGGQLGMAFNVDEKEVGIILLDEGEQISAGTEVHRTDRVLDFPVGQELLGRVIDAKGRPVDGKGALGTSERRSVERSAPAIMDREPVTVPLQTGLKVVDALIPIGRGQRELILGDRQSGKTTIGMEAIINQKGTGVRCIYCAIGKRASAAAKVIDDLRNHDVMDFSIVLVTTEENVPGLQFVAPYAAMTMAEYFMEQGEDVLVVLDDLTRHARAYRELSLLLRRPPGREAYPGDIFYIHSRMLERSTHLRSELGGGSLTALPIIETEAQNISAYIPTNLISITDGQIYLSPDLFQKGILPAIDVGKSVSRVGGKTQLPAYRAVAGDLRLSYSQFEELESFSRFGTRLDEETRKSLEHGQRVREILKQSQYQPVPVSEQIAVLVAVNEGVLDEIPLEKVAETEKRIRDAVRDRLPEICERIEQGEKLNDEDIRTLRETAESVLDSKSTESRDADH